MALEQAIRSIRDQVYSNWEFIMCDGESSENTYEVAALAVQESRIVLLRNETSNCFKLKYIKTHIKDEYITAHSDAAQKAISVI